MIEIDRSYGEGGGALLRTSIAISAVTSKFFSLNQYSIK
jgi:RNA 3'-terminal phosphate cyclase